MIVNHTIITKNVQFIIFLSINFILALNNYNIIQCLYIMIQIRGLGLELCLLVFNYRFGRIISAR